MIFDPQHCYDALKSRDSRFDGRFFVAVKTTGIYCRPVCPARTPKQENVAFYPCAAAAETAGFRPCLRCRPETAPGTPAWQGAPSTVSRALRLISEGALDDGNVESLASTLGIGARQLRRLFIMHLGASPIAIAQTRRVQFAKNLIDETSLPLADIAFQSGFASIRRFNDAFRHSYGMAPGRLRRKKASENGGSPLVLRLRYRAPYQWGALLTFLAGRAIPGVECVTDTSYRRTVRSDGATGTIEVSNDAASRSLVLRVPPQLARDLKNIVERTRRLFDLSAEPDCIATHLSDDPLLVDAVHAWPGLRVPGAWDGFEVGVRAILGQQISVKAATTISGRLVAHYGTPLEQDGVPLTHLFPQPTVLARAKLDGIGITQQRAETIRGFASAIANETQRLGTASNLDETIQSLRALPGIGPWTAQYMAMRIFREPDAFPAGDLALQRAASDGGLGRLSERQLSVRAEPWRPWRAYAAMHLWSMYSDSAAQNTAARQVAGG